ncbi:MAG: hypothetical protein WDZ31_10065 [Phycisphaeraceae bacterium]
MLLDRHARRGGGGRFQAVDASPGTERHLAAQAAQRLDLPGKGALLLAQPGQQRRVHRLGHGRVVAGHPALRGVRARPGRGHRMLKTVRQGRPALGLILLRIVPPGLPVAPRQPVPPRQRAATFRVRLLLKGRGGLTHHRLPLDLVPRLVVAAGAEHHKWNGHQDRPPW